MMRRWFYFMFLVLFLQLQSFGQERCRLERRLMGTSFVVACYAEDRARAEDAMKRAFDIAEKFEDMASDYKPESELSQLSKSPIGKSTPISRELYKVLAQAQTLAELTEGAFDPTLGPLTELWRESRRTGKVPSEAALTEAKSRVGWKRFTLSQKPENITLHRHGMRFDLGGIGKGYVADLMLESMNQQGISSVMIAAGGDIRLGEPPPGKAGWKVALQSFDRGRFDEVHELSNVAISTSGDLHQSIGIEGIRYSHIVSPISGLGLTERVSATVISDSGAMSDAIATAACVVGKEALSRFQKISGIRAIKIKLP